MTAIDGPTLTRAEAAEEKRSWLDSHEHGYEKTLKPRQIQMIAIGGAIGTGLFLGAGARRGFSGELSSKSIDYKQVKIICKGNFSVFAWISSQLVDSGKVHNYLQVSTGKNKYCRGVGGKGGYRPGR